MAGDPFLIGVVAGVAGDDVQVAGLGARGNQVTAPQLVAGEDRVRVRVDEPGQQGAAVQIDGLGGPQRAQVRAHLRDALDQPGAGNGQVRGHHGRHRGELSRELIVTESLRLLDTNGMAGFSLPKLGRALGADPTAVYRHFAMYWAG